MATVPPLDPYISKPKVYLVGRQHVASDELARFLADEGMVFSTDAPAGGEALAEVAGRVCYMSFGKGRKSNHEYIENILASKHGSVLEHAVWCVLMTGISRALTHELVRHRAGFGYSQLSQRYVDEGDARYVVPPLYQENPELLAKWRATIEILRKAYVELGDATVEYVQQKHPEMAPRIGASGRGKRPDPFFPTLPKPRFLLREIPAPGGTFWNSAAAFTPTRKSAYWP